MSEVELSESETPDEALETALKRRNLIATHSNPTYSLDYVATLKGKIPVASSGRSIRVTVRYVPDKLVFDDASWATYLASVGLIGEGLEAVAATVVADLNNELVPRWVHVHLSDSDDTVSSGHGVVMEDRQPNWDNPELLRRLAPF